LTLKGKFCSTQQETFEKCKNIIENLATFDNYKALSVSGIHFNNAGANTVQELAFSLSAGNDYMSNLTDLGVDATLINKKLKFHFGIGGNYFFEIAKFRAARFLWGQIMQKYGVSKEESQMHIHAQTTEWNKTIYDPYTNMLRTTTEAMSAVLGGVESLTVDPFNKIFEDTNNFSERIARNQQIVLKEEAYFDKVTDPAAGSYYIENLTNEIAQKAWKLFLEIENKGGYIKAFMEGFIQNMLSEEAKSRKNAIVNRQENLLGINQYPNFNESKQQIDFSVLEPENQTAKDAQVSGIIRYRGAQQFEKLRFRTDEYSLKNKRPLAFMLTYGSVAFSGARSQFSQNFFAIAGFKVQDNPNFETVEAGVQSAIKANADIVVLCSADEEYAKIAPEAFELLGNKGILVVAGFPKDIVDELKTKGIENFIHIRSNVLESLEEFQKKLNII
jgi:methylmalonyl-CoA mutase